MADPGTIELVKLIGGGVGLGTFCTYVAFQLRDQTRLLASMNRKHGRTEVLQIATYESVTGRRVKRADTAPAGYPITAPARPRNDSDDPPNVGRTITEDFGDG